jgi:FtsZ-binding cell division protein ZapB
METDELDQFELLEQRVEALISLVNSLKEENVTLERRVQEGGEELRSLKKETEGLMAGREAVRERIARLLRKIEECA